MSQTVAVAAIVGSLAIAVTARPQANQARQPLRILFIGNSLTAANNLPDMVESLGRARGRKTVETMAVTANNFSLEDHWTQGKARAAIARGEWSVVVLQQGPSALPESRVLLRAYAKRFADEARTAGARTALYMVWPSKARTQDFDGVSESYSLAARDVEGVLLPAGEAWREAWRRDPSLTLYGDDGFHPSRMGSYPPLWQSGEASRRSPCSACPARAASPLMRSGCFRNQSTTWQPSMLRRRRNPPSFDDRTTVALR